MDGISTLRSTLASGRADVARNLTREVLVTSADPDADAAQIAEDLYQLYRDFDVTTVHTFVEGVTNDFEPSIVKKLTARVQPEIDLTLEWNKRLDELGNERIINELVDAVKGNSLDTAQELVRSLLDSARDGQQLAARARQIGYTLGGLIHEKDRCDSLLRTIARNPQKFGVDASLAGEMQEELQKASIAAVRRERAAAAVSRVGLTQATVELSRSLPGRMALHEPQAEDITAFDRQVRALIRCCLLSYEHNRFHEATQLMVEFVPKDVSSSGQMAGVEQRLYATLGRTARAVAGRVFTSLGSLPVVFNSYETFVASHVRDNIGRPAVEVLGLLGNLNATQLLIKVMTDKKLDVRAEAIYALGTLGDPAAIKCLTAALETDLHARVLEGNTRRDAILLVTALGRAARSQDPRTRNRMIAQVLKLLPRQDTEMMLRATLGFFVGKLDEIDPKLLEWAATAATVSLWSIDRPEMGRAARTQPLGFRQPLINLLERLAPSAMSAINDTAMHNAKSFSGAYLALGEFYAKCGNESCLPVLRQLITNTFLLDDNGPKSAYVKETVLDAASEERVDLTRDKVLASLVHAVDTIGGEEAQLILSELFQQIQSGRLTNPGGETAEILMNAHMRQARTAGVSAFPLPGEQGQDPARRQAGVAATVTEADLQHMKDLETLYLLANKRRAKKVGALAALAQRRILPALPLAIRHTGDSDPVIAAAAITAVTEYCSPGAAPEILEKAHTELLGALCAANDAQRLKLGEILLRLGPGRSPLKEKLDSMMQRTDLPIPVRGMLMRLLNVQASGKSAGGPARTAPDGTSVGADPSETLTGLEKKRQYIMARQEWIKGGKRGPEPAMPE